jgi:hypothetical protein
VRHTAAGVEGSCLSFFFSGLLKLEIILRVSMENIITILIYLIFFGFVIYCWYIEHKDIHCPDLSSSQAECDEKGGMPTSGVQPSPNDTCDTLVHKLYEATKTESKTIRWRLSLLMSTAIILAIWLLVMPFSNTSTLNIGFVTLPLPEWQLFILSVLIGFAILLGMFTYYNYHIYHNARKWSDQIMEMLKEKNCINKFPTGYSSGAKNGSI